MSNSLAHSALSPMYTMGGEAAEEKLSHEEPDDDWAGVPSWAVWSFFACGVLIVAVLLLDYCVIRRNALGNTCCTGRNKSKRANGGTGNGVTSSSANSGGGNSSQQAAAHQKRSTNMLLNKMSRSVQMDQNNDMY